MWWTPRVGACLFALLSCVSSKARACEPSFWTVTNEGPCLTSASDAGHEFTNTCDEAVTLIQIDCANACSDALEFEVGETKSIRLPSPPRNGQVIEFFYVADAEEHTLIFEYQENLCSSEEGCAVARRGRTPHAVITMVLLVVGVRLGRRGDRFRRRAASPTSRA